jgi:hypothetical protein
MTRFLTEPQPREPNLDAIHPIRGPNDHLIELESLGFLCVHED